VTFVMCVHHWLWNYTDYGERIKNVSKDINNGLLDRGIYPRHHRKQILEYYAAMVKISYLPSLPKTWPWLK